MENTPIWEISSALRSPVIVAGFDSKVIQAWDVTSRVMISELDTIFLSGTANLAVSPDGKYVVVGRCRRRGIVAAYDIPKGNLVWKRDNLIFPSFMGATVSGKQVWCGTGDGQTRVEFLDLESGETLTAIDHAEKFRDGPYGVSLLVADGEGNHEMRGAATRSFRRMGTILDACFLPDAVCIAEICSPVRCVSYADAEERWRFQRPGNSHVYLLHWSNRLQAIFGVNLGLETGNTFRRLIRLEADTGKVTDICALRSRHTEAFIPATDQMITSDGDLIDLATGAQVDRLEFHRKSPRLR